MARARIAGKTLVACLSINMVRDGGREGGREEKEEDEQEER